MESVQIRRPQNRPETRRTTKAAGEEKLRVAAYCRVSTDSDEQETSFETQVEVYEKKIRANPAWEYAGVYTDEGITGTKASKRPGFQKMIKDAENGKIEIFLSKWIQSHNCETAQKSLEIRHFTAFAPPSAALGKGRFSVLWR